MTTNQPWVQELEDSFNYGLFQPPLNGRAGKFLDEERRLAEYPFQGSVGHLEVTCSSSSSSSSSTDVMSANDTGGRNPRSEGVCDGPVACPMRMGHRSVCTK